MAATDGSTLYILIYYCELKNLLLHVKVRYLRLQVENYAYETNINADSNKMLPSTASHNEVTFLVNMFPFVH